MSAPADLERHPLSAVWGDMPDAEFEALVEDVRIHGVRQPIALYEGKVVDGWHRIQAAIRAGLHDVETFKIEDSPEGDDPAGFVIAANAFRRHLTPGDRARIILDLRGHDSAPVGTNQHEGPSHDAPTNRELADEAGVSVPTIEREKRKRREGGAQLSDKPPRIGTLRHQLDQLEQLVDALKHRIATLEDEVQAALVRNCGEVARENESLRGDVLRLRRKVGRLEAVGGDGATVE